MTVSADPSRQYVLDDQAPYLRNLAALWTVDPDLAAEIERLPDSELYPLEPAKDGNWTVAIPSPGGAKIYLHSRYRPAEEGAKLVDGIDFDQKYVFYVHGMGLGYHVDPLLEKASREAIVVVFEPDIRLLKTLFWRRDFGDALADQRLIVVAGGDKGALFSRISSKIALVASGSHAVRHPASLQLHSEYHAEAERWIEGFESYARTCINTLVLNGRRTCENISRNIGWYAATGAIDRLKDRYKGKPAIVVSAGPSLRKNKHLLKGLEDKAVIVAVQTTLQPLLEMGVEPHFVTSLDYHDISARFFEKLPKNLRVELVAEPKAASVVLGLHTGPVTILGSDYAERLLKEMRPRKGTLRSGGTVAHLAFYLAEHLGCDPVIFLGQDLGFSDGLCYTPGTSYEDVWRPELTRFCTVEMKQWEHIIRERHILRRIPDYEGRPMYTEERLYTYLQQFERDFLQTTTKIIDATEGGARKRGAQSMPFAEAIAQYCSEGGIQRFNDYPAPDWSRLEACRQSLRNRQQEAEEIEAIAEKTLPLLEGIRDSLDDQGKVNHLIAKIDDLRNRMNELADCYELVTQLTQGTELDRYRRDRAIAASRAKGSDRQRRQVARDIDNVLAIRTAAGEFRKLMDEVIGRLS